MNLGTLPTIGNNECDNYILLIIDNGSYGSTGDQTTYSGMKTSLAEVARACGCAHVIECSAEETVAAVTDESQAIRAQLSSQNANQETFRCLLSTKTL